MLGRLHNSFCLGLKKKKNAPLKAYHPFKVNVDFVICYMVTCSVT